MPLRATARKMLSGYQKLARCKIQSGFSKDILLQAAERYLELYENAQKDINVLGARNINLNTKGLSDATLKRILPTKTDLRTSRASVESQAANQLDILLAARKKLSDAQASVHARCLPPLEAILIHGAELRDVGIKLTGKVSPQGGIDAALVLIGIALEDLAKHFRLFGP